MGIGKLAVVGLLYCFSLFYCFLQSPLLHMQQFVALAECVVVRCKIVCSFVCVDYTVQQKCDTLVTFADLPIFTGRYT